MKKKLLAVAMGAMLAAGAANAVTVNHAGLGDLLVAPVQLIGGGSQNAHTGAAFDLVYNVDAKGGNTEVRGSDGKVLGYITRSDAEPFNGVLALDNEPAPRYKIRIERGPQRQRMQT